MECRHLSSWTEFKSTLDELERERASLKEDRRGPVSQILYRGQADASWDLTTTLERYLGSPPSMLEYYKSVTAIAPQVETFTERTWSVPEYSAIHKQLKDPNFHPRFLPAYGFLAYLRHNGFPSPLLDWTRSPFVAAHFAFERPNLTAERVAVYAYLEFTGLAKISWQCPPKVTVPWPDIRRSHPRHFRQQSEYTVCTERRDEVWYFSNYEEGLSGSGPSQDRLWKITIPSSESSAARSDLERFNITAYSLFGSEESLLETLAARELWRPGQAC